MYPKKALEANSKPAIESVTHFKFGKERARVFVDIDNETVDIGSQAAGHLRRPAEIGCWNNIPNRNNAIEIDSQQPSAHVTIDNEHLKTHYFPTQCGCMHRWLDNWGKHCRYCPLLLGCR